MLRCSAGIIPLLPSPPSPCTLTLFPYEMQWCFRALQEQQDERSTKKADCRCWFGGNMEEEGRLDYEKYSTENKYKERVQ